MTSAGRRRRKRFPGKTVLGVTGGVGAGKSLILELLREEYGAEILQADRVCGELIENEGGAFGPIVRLLGEEVLDEAGRIDRKKMAQMIFNDDPLRQKVNRILHPATFREVCSRIRQSDASLAVYESALPQEARFREICDKVIYVYASEETRMRRLSKSRGYSEEKARSIMQAQMTEEEFKAFADASVINDGTVEEAKASLEQVLSGWWIGKKS